MGWSPHLGSAASLSIVQFELIAESAAATVEPEAAAGEDAGLVPTAPEPLWAVNLDSEGCLHATQPAMAAALTIIRIITKTLLENPVPRADLASLNRLSHRRV